MIQDTEQYRIIRGRDGFAARMLVEPGEADHVSLLLDDGRKVMISRRLVHHGEDGALHLDMTGHEFEQTYLRPDEPAHRRQDDAHQVIPVVEEQLQVERYKVETGRVRVQK